MTSFSEGFGDARRSYQFEVRTSQDGSAYLVIIEDSGQTGHRQRSQIMLSQEQLPDFQRCLQQAVSVMTGEAMSPEVAPKERIGEKWTAEEEEFVLDEYASGRTIAEIARSVLRKPGGIRRRLKRLEIMDAPDSRAAAQALLAEREEAVAATPPAPTKRVVEHDPELDHGIDFASL